MKGTCFLEVMSMIVCSFLLIISLVGGMYLYFGNPDDSEWLDEFSLSPIHYEGPIHKVTQVNV